MKKISIIGAGIGGLTLANALEGLAERFNVEVFEREAGVHVRPQGYMVGLKDTGGILALKKLGLYEKFRSVGHPGTSLIFFPRKGKGF